MAVQTCVQPWRYALAGLLIVGGFVLVGARVTQIQAIEGPRWQAKAEDARVREGRVQAQRGTIIDRHGHLLAGSRPMYDVGVDPQVFEAPTGGALYHLAALLELTYPQLQAKLADKRFADGRLRRWKPLGRVPSETYAEIAALKIKGVRGDLQYQRHYPNGPLAAHLIGFVNREGVASTGAEHAMDFYLQGADGFKVVERAGNRRELASHRRLNVPARTGLTLQLTIDAVIQAIVEEELGRMTEEMQPEAAVAIVSDAQTGAILALANYPTFDLNAFGKKENQDKLRNRAVTDPYEPGSTFKTVAFAGALEQNIVNENTLIDCATPDEEWGGRRFLLPRDHKEIGIQPAHHAFAMSSNRGTARVAFALGLEGFLDTARAFGFGERPAWPLEAEATGLLRRPDQMQPIDFSRMAAGYAISATPLQIHYATATIAARGMRPEPQLFDSLQTEDGTTVLRFEPRWAGRAISARTAERMSVMLAEVVREGTAKRADIPGYTVAGKTGTARAYLRNPETGRGGYTEREHTASFTGFFPVEEPALVITVIVDRAEVPGVAYGSKVAAPVFQRIGTRTAQYLSLPSSDELPPVAPFAEAPLFADLTP